MSDSASESVAELESDEEHPDGISEQSWHPDPYWTLSGALPPAHTEEEMESFVNFVAARNSDFYCASTSPQG